MSLEDSDLDDFIVSDDEQQQAVPDEQESLEPRSRLADITNALRPGEDRTQKVLKAHISVLVSALGGPDHTSPIYPPPYKLGHEALACLKDLKRWIKTVDERLKSYDVALACADSGLVVNDLIVIMCQWEKQLSSSSQAQKKNMEKILLSCLELLVLLTWPVELNGELSDKQKLAFPNLKKIQVDYKKHILSYNDGQVLKAILRLILPNLTKQRLDREPRDNAIIRMALFLIRNVLFIEPATTTISSKLRKQIQTSENLPANVSKDDISINTTVKVFEKNNVLKFLLTIIGSLGTNFDRDVFAHCSLECIYLLVKKLDPESFSRISNPDKPDTENIAKGSLASLLQKEHKMKVMQKLSVSTRHGRFGTLLSIQSEDSSYVISGQEALHDTDATLAKLDRSKKWHTRTTFKYDSDDFVSENIEYVLEDVKKIVLNFLELFLDSGCFNSMIESVAWLFTSNGDLAYSDAYEKAAHFLTIAWFFKFKRLLNLTLSKVDYGSVGVALNETNFILLLSYVRASYDARDWNSVHVALLCFRELLLLSHSIFTRKHVEDEEKAEIYDRELAEGIIHKLFETKQFLDLLIEIPKTAAKHSPDYLNVCVSVVNQLLKTFEVFSNQDIALYVKTKKRQSKKKKKDQNTDDEPEAYRYADLVDGSDEEENERRLNLVTRERKLDFGETEVRFFHPSIVTTHISFLARYEDLSNEDIKKAISYFHRLFVVRKDVTNLYRLDFMQLIHKLRSDLPSNSGIREVVDDFIYYFMKRFKEAFKRFPMPIEILFPRIEDLAYKTYLGSGELFVKEEKRLRPPKLAREIEFTRSSLTKDEQFKILVTALFEAEHEKWLDWFINELQKLQEKRIFDENEELLLPTHSQFTRSIISNSVVRLLLFTVGFKLPLYVEQECVLPTSVTSEVLSEAIELLKQWIIKQPAVFDDGNPAAFYIRAKDTYDNEDDGFHFDAAYDIDDESIAFETKGALINSQYAQALDELDQLEENMEENTPRKKRRKGVARTKGRPKDRPIKTRGPRNPPKFNVNSDDEVDKPVKSSEYIRDSDDESDDEKTNEFFQREEKLRSMLEAAGGIVNAQQLAEFKKAWGSMHKGDTPVAVQEAIDKAVLNDLDMDLELGDTSQTPELTSQSIPPSPTETHTEDLHYSENEEAETSKTSRKRKLIIEDDDDDDE